MKTLFAIGLLALAGGCATTPVAPRDKLAMAHTLMELDTTPEVWVASYRAYADEIIARTSRYEENCEEAGDAAHCRTVFAKLMKNLRILLDGAVADTALFRKAYIDAAARLYADAYTEAELSTALAFADSPEGRSIRAKAPDLVKQASAIHYDATLVWSNGLEQRVSDLMASFGDDFATPSNEY